MDRLLAIIRTIISESVSDMKAQPAFSFSCLSASWLAMLPLWPILSSPLTDDTVMGCAFFIDELPAVEYLTCPIPVNPLVNSSPKSFRTSVTSPIPFWVRCSLSWMVIPADSCPLCCKALRPTVIKFSTGDLLAMPRTPHASLRGISVSWPSYIHGLLHYLQNHRRRIFSYAGGRHVVHTSGKSYGSASGVYLELLCLYSF